MSEFLLEAGK